MNRNKSIIKFVCKKELKNKNKYDPSLLNFSQWYWGGDKIKYALRKPSMELIDSCGCFKNNNYRSKW